jgi:N-acetylglucosamine kinase-like BadF-type ATPase
VDITSQLTWVIGIDAGGTSVRAALADGATGIVSAETKIAADADGGPGILGDLVPPLLRDAGIAPGNVGAVCAGITKITRAGVRERWETELRSLLPSVASVTVVPDYVIAFHGALPAGVGVSVVAGTGSVVYGENGRGEAVRVGGRGWEYGDEGSGAWLTTEAVRRTLRALDGMDKPTPLTRAVCAALGTDEPAALGEAARQSAADEGRGFLVPLILGLARGGDTEATNLFIGAAGWLGAQARAAAVRLGFTTDDPLTVATVGGMWESGDLLRVPFQTVLRRWYPNVAVTPPDAAPVIGAIRVALTRTNTAR